MKHYPFKDYARTWSPSSLDSNAHSDTERVGDEEDVPHSPGVVTLPRLTDRTESGDTQARVQPDISGRMSSQRSVERTKSAMKKTAMSNISTAVCLSNFLDWCHEKYGHSVRVFRMLDKSGNMKLSKRDFTMGLSQLGYNHREELGRLWEVFDRDQTGWVSFLHFAAEDAVVLAHFKHWADTEHGSCAGVFHALDSSRDGKLSYVEFSRGLKRLGFTTHVHACMRTLFDLIDDSGDDSSKRCITAQEIGFMDKWDCPEYLWAEPDVDGKGPFLQAIIKKYHNNPLLAWRKALDTDSSMRVSYYEFIKAYKLLSNKGVFEADVAKCVPGLFRALDKSNTGWLSLRDFDGATYDTLITFATWAKREFGKVHLFCKHVAGPDNAEKVNFKAFKGAMKDGLGLAKDAAWRLFEGLSLESKKEGTIKPDELFFLDRWDFRAELEEELAWEKMMYDIESQMRGETAENAESTEAVTNLS